MEKTFWNRVNNKELLEQIGDGKMKSSGSMKTRKKPLTHWQKQHHNGRY